VARVVVITGPGRHRTDPVGVVPPVLAGDIVAILALLARQGDLRTDSLRALDPPLTVAQARIEQLLAERAQAQAWARAA